MIHEPEHTDQPYSFWTPPKAVPEMRCLSCGHQSECCDFSIGYEDEIIDTCPACGTVNNAEEVRDA